MRPEHSTDQHLAASATRLFAVRLGQSVSQVAGESSLAHGRIGPNVKCLGDQPAPSLDEITQNPEFEATEIDRVAFEAIWSTALDSDEP